MTGLLTARDVAARLNVSTESVLRWTRRGKLPGFRLPGGALRYRESDLAEWLMERATSNSTSTAHPVRYLKEDARPLSNSAMRLLLGFGQRSS